MPPPRKFGPTAQEPTDHDTSPLLPPTRVTRIQQIVGTIMYYARAVDLTALVALSSIASEQAKATVDTEQRIEQLLDYLHTHKDATTLYSTSTPMRHISARRKPEVAREGISSWAVSPKMGIQSNSMVPFTSLAPSSNSSQHLRLRQN